MWHIKYRATPLEGYVLVSSSSSNLAFSPGLKSSSSNSAFTRMGGNRNIAQIIYLLSLLTLCSSSPLPFGAHPLDDKYYDSGVIKCKDGSNYFTRDRINDGFCDCPDGTDEPGTSACPVGRFYCKNLGSKPRFLFSSRINDRICDCCDGSDEYDGGTICSNTCVMGGTVSYHSISRSSVIKRHSSVGAERTDVGMNTQDSVKKLNGLKVLVALQVIVVVIFVAFWVLRWRSKSKKRHRY